MATLVFRPGASHAAGQAIGIDIAVGTASGPASYATGGNVVDLAGDFGLKNDPYMVQIEVAGDAYRAVYDYAGKKILMYVLRDSTASNIGAEVANATNLSAVSMRIICHAQA